MHWIAPTAFVGSTSYQLMKYKAKRTKTFFYTTVFNDVLCHGNARPTIAL